MTHYIEVPLDSPKIVTKDKVIAFQRDGNVTHFRHLSVYPKKGASRIQSEGKRPSEILFG